MGLAVGFCVVGLAVVKLDVGLAVGGLSLVGTAVVGLPVVMTQSPPPLHFTGKPRQSGLVSTRLTPVHWPLESLQTQLQHATFTRLLTPPPLKAFGKEVEHCT